MIPNLSQFLSLLEEVCPRERTRTSPSGQDLRFRRLDATALPKQINPDKIVSQLNTINNSSWICRIRRGGLRDA